jgi:hypothetical protein
MNLLVRYLKGLGVTLAVLGVLFGLIQLIPYGRTHSNPPTILEPTWDSPRTRELAVRACFDCHSNETKWPWYANVAPMSWIVEYDINNGRSIINFSEWNRHYPLAPASGLSVRTGSMPIGKYKVAHPEAQLTPEETEALARGLDATLGIPDRH